jgi:hypothetical protein
VAALAFDLGEQAACEHFSQRSLGLLVWHLSLESTYEIFIEAVHIFLAVGPNVQRFRKIDRPDGAMSLSLHAREKDLNFYQAGLPHIVQNGSFEDEPTEV